jgi:hypothetical protein
MIDNTAIDNLWIEWIKALKSKKSLEEVQLSHATGHLCKRSVPDAPNGYCCLGVLCLISEELNLNLAHDKWRQLSLVDSQHNPLLFEKVFTPLGNSEKVNLIMRTIMYMNDSYLSWPIEFLIEKIAPDHLKETLRNL